MAKGKKDFSDAALDRLFADVKDEPEDGQPITATSEKSVPECPCAGCEAYRLRKVNGSLLEALKELLAAYKQERALRYKQIDISFTDGQEAVRIKRKARAAIEQAETQSEL